MSLTDPGPPVKRPQQPSEEDRKQARAGRAGNALALGLLAGVVALTVLVYGLWLTRDDTREHNEHPWQTLLVLAVVFGLMSFTIRQLTAWSHLRAKPVSPGRVALLLLVTGLMLFPVIATILSAAGAPEWAIGTAGTLGLVALMVAGTIALLLRSGRKRGSGGATDSAPTPGSGTDYAERVLHGVTGEPGALRPTPDEEAVLEQAIAEQYHLLGRSGNALLALPTVARQADLVLPVPEREALARGRQVLASAGTHLVGGWVEPDRATLRGWWQSGPRLNGCPVVVSVWLAADGPQTTQVAVRSASKVFLLNRHIPERALERVVIGLGGHPGPGE